VGRKVKVLFLLSYPQEDSPTMNAVLKVLLIVCCIALSSAIIIVLPGNPSLQIDFPLTEEEYQFCRDYLYDFKETFRTPSVECGGAAFDTMQWNNFKLGFSAVKEPVRDFGTSFDDCMTKDHGTPIQLAYCNYINNVISACRCDKATCSAGLLVGRLTPDKTACKGVLTTMCETSQKAMETPCAAALSARGLIPMPQTVRYDKTKVDLKCAPGDCPKRTL